MIMYFERPTSRRRCKTGRSVAIVTVALLIATLAPGAAGAAPGQQEGGPETIGPGVLEAVQKGHSPVVIIALDAGASDDLDERRDEVTAAQDDVLAEVNDEELEVRRRYAAVPALAAVAHSEEALHRLADHPRVVRIDLDVGGTGALDDSVPVIRADLRHARGNEGTGTVVAVLDTGFDSGHDDLAGALLHEACFGDNTGSIDGTGFCPDGSDRQTGSGAAQDDAGHGTHVTGIITSVGAQAGTGVAPDAGIVAIKVLNNCSFSGCFTSFGEIVAALDYIIDNPQLGVQVVNMSLGTGTLFSGECDDATAFTQAGADAADALRAAGVTLFASAGNSGSGTQMPAPACLSSVISVGATDDDDNVWGSSNSNPETDIFAPGVSIVSSLLGGGTTSASGTSMASPHAAGCAALLIEAGDASTPDGIETRLEDSDEQVTDPTNGLTFPRIDCVPDSNQAPELTADQAGVTADEGDTATNTGTVSDPDGDAVTLSASVGTVVDNEDGTWSWTFDTIDGPADSQEVTITGTDAIGEDAMVSFDLTVSNAAPIVDAGPDTTVLSSEIVTFSGAFSDPGVIDFPWDWVIDWGDSTETTGSTIDQTLPITAQREFCAAGGYMITLSVTDKDSDTGSDIMQLTVEHVSVPIDVKPREGRAPISLSSQGMIPVAVFSTADFDATSLDPAAVTLGDGSPSGTPVAERPNGTLFVTVEDVDGDGQNDLVLHFRTQELVENGDLGPATTELHLEGFLQDGCTNVLGSDEVTVVP